MSDPDPAPTPVSVQGGTPTAADGPDDGALADGSGVEASPVQPGGSTDEISGLDDAPDAPPEPSAPPAFMIRCPACGGHFDWTPDIEMVAPLASPSHKTCETCEGIGKLATGSAIAEHAIIVCDDCGGKGYVGAPAIATISIGAPPTVQPWPNAVWNPATGQWQ